jgi:excisionase family DNA binding protein
LFKNNDVVYSPKWSGENEPGLYAASHDGKLSNHSRHTPEDALHEQQSLLSSWSKTSSPADSVNGERLLTIPQVAQYLGISRAQVYKLINAINDDRLPCVHIGRSVRVVWSTMEAGNLLRRSFWPLLEKAGLARMPFHSLRHSTASLLLSIGVHPKIMQELLGHSNISMTLDTYSHVIPALHAEAATQLNTLLTKRKTPVAVNQG